MIYTISEMSKFVFNENIINKIVKESKENMINIILIYRKYIKRNCQI